MIIITNIHTPISIIFIWFLEVNFCRNLNLLVKFAHSVNSKESVVDREKNDKIREKKTESLIMDMMPNIKT